MADRPLNSAQDEAQRRQVTRRSRKAVFVIPSLLTTANIFCGFYSVMESLLGVQALSLGQIAGAAEHFNRAAINIGFAALFDFLDGRIARMTNATSEFGIELDSIADVVSFGMAPALLAYAWGYGHVASLHKIAWAASFLFLICGALRLARFNVQARQPKPNQPPKNPKMDKKGFVGMPIPAGASLIAALAHFSPEPVGLTQGIFLPALNRSLAIDGRFFSLALIVIVVCLAFLMVSTIRYSSFKNIGPRNHHARVLIPALALVVLALWLYSQWSFLIISTVYASHGVLGKLWSLLKPRRALATDRPELDADSKPQSEISSR